MKTISKNTFKFSHHITYIVLLKFNLIYRGRALNDYHEKFKTIKTVEEKMIGVNMPKLYGFKCVELNEDKIPIQALKFIQHSTRTHLIVQDKLPEYYIDYDTPASFIAKELQGEIEDAIKFEFQLVK